MSFTDEEIKKLKDEIERANMPLRDAWLVALLARLEAAEAVIESADGQCPHTWTDHDLGPCEVALAMKVWRKAAGKSA